MPPIKALFPYQRVGARRRTFLEKTVESFSIISREKFFPHPWPMVCPASFMGIFPSGFHSVVLGIRSVGGGRMGNLRRVTHFLFMW